MNEEKIWKFLKSKGFTDFGVAGLMGNLYAESGLSPINLQNSYEKKLNFTDQSYTQAVDNGSYTNFVKDAAGYGLAQWTYWSRKQNLLNYARSVGKSIGDLDMQLEFLCKELSGYSAVWKTLQSAKSVLRHLMLCYYSMNDLLTKAKPFKTNVQAMDKLITTSLHRVRQRKELVV